MTDNHSSKSSPSGLKTFTTVIFLFVFYPIGLILMYAWMKWPIWVKILLTVLLIPVAIFGLALTAGILMTMINPAEQFKAADDTQRASDIKAISHGARMYYKDNNVYPAQLDLLVPEYLAAMPVDPSTKMQYQYVLGENGQFFQVCADYALEKTESETNPSCISSDVK